METTALAVALRPMDSAAYFLDTQLRKKSTACVADEKQTQENCP